MYQRSGELKEGITFVRLKIVTIICKEVELFRGIPVGRILQYAIGIHEQTGLDLAERIFSGELGIENRFELTDGGEMFEVTIAGMLYAFFKTISWNDLEKLLEVAIHCRGYYFYIEIVSALQHSAGADVVNHNPIFFPDTSEKK